MAGGIASAYIMGGVPGVPLNFLMVSLMEKVLIELVVSANIASGAILTFAEDRLPNVRIDMTYEPVAMEPRPEDRARVGENETVVVLRGTVDRERKDELAGRPGVLRVWTDARVEPFAEQ